MDSAQEAEDYDAMDHSAVNTTFVHELLAFWKPRRDATPTLLDVGTGTALIPIAAAKRMRFARIWGIDLATHMLARAAENVEREGLQDRITLAAVDAKELALEQRFDAVLCNSLVHHIADPGAVLQSMLARVAPGGVLFVRDLYRPEADALLDAIVTRYSGEQPADATEAARWQRQRDLFNASMHAALTLEEMRNFAVSVGLPADCVNMSSDRHWTLAHRTSAFAHT